MAKATVPSHSITVPELVPVQSTTISMMGYCAKEQELFVMFLGTPGFVYRYKNTPQKLWELFQSVGEANTVLVAAGQPDAAVSLGSLFHYTVKRFPEVYPFSKHPIG